MDSYLVHCQALIDQYVRKEYDEQADFSDLSKIDIAYTHSDCGSYEIQASVDLHRRAITVYVNDVAVKSSRYEKEVFVKWVLPYLDFSDLVSLDEEDYAYFHSLQSVQK